MLVTGRATGARARRMRAGTSWKYFVYDAADRTLAHVEEASEGGWRIWRITHERLLPIMRPEAPRGTLEECLAVFGVSSTDILP